MEAIGGPGRTVGEVCVGPGVFGKLSRALLGASWGMPERLGPKRVNFCNGFEGFGCFKQPYASRWFYEGVGGTCFLGEVV